MKPRSAKPRESNTNGTLRAIRPSGSPDWVTDELIAETIDVWQPYYSNSLTPDDALEILMGVTKLFEFLYET